MAGPPPPRAPRPSAPLAPLAPLAGLALHLAPQQPGAWNHLQVPNYYSRQPQAAHMSSDRSLSHSPLTWHTPTPPDHQQVKGGSNLYRRTPPPSDVPLLKGTQNSMYRHTPTPPDRDSLKAYRHTPTPPDVQNVKSASNPLYRHTSTPPEMVLGMKGNVSVYRHTPPPEGIKGVSNPLFNLQQMITDRNTQAHVDSIRDNLIVRNDNMGFPRLSPGLAVGSVDLSVARSPRNGNQNGDLVLPMSLSVRDTSKINSLDSAEISKIQQLPSNYGSKSMTDISKASSPTINSLSQSSNSPKSPKSSNKRPVKKVDSILERLNSGCDGVVITPVQHTPSPHSVIVSAHTLEDSNSRGSSSSFNITPVMGNLNYPSCEQASIERAMPSNASYFASNDSLPSSTNTATVFTSSKPVLTVKDPSLLESQSVIKESPMCSKDDLQSMNFSNDDSNGSSNDSNKAKNRRKQLKTLRMGIDDIHEAVHDDLTLLNTPLATKNNHENDNRIQSEISCIPQVPQNISQTNAEYPSNSDASMDNGVTNKLIETSSEENAISIVSKTRRKTSSESETIDDIAAMIASTDSSDKLISDATDGNISMYNLPSKTLPNTPLTENLNQLLSSPNAATAESDKPPTPKTCLPDPLDKPKIDSESSEILENKIVQTATNVLQPQEKSEFVEVENELEKMFAGIEEPNVSVANESSDPTTEFINKDDMKTDKARNLNKTPGKKRTYRKSSDAASSGLLSSDENTPKKKQKLTKRKSISRGNYDIDNISASAGNSKKSKNLNLNKKGIAKTDNILSKDAYDSGSNASSSKSRGPYVQIKGPRDSPLSVNIINTPIHEEDVDKPLQKIKSLKSKASLVADSNFKNKVKSKGLHSSTLSMKYDATTTDTSWICVFCKKGPHTGPSRDSLGDFANGKAQHMGDLFGPYIISTDCPDYNSMMEDPYDTMFKGKPKTGTFLQNKQSMRGKKIKTDSDVIEEKSNFPNEEMYMGMTEATVNSFEIWLHEDCAVWAPGLYLVGSKIVGLESAVWSCCTMRCDLCNFLGATVACIKRGCEKKMHVNCARADLWSLSEDNFLVYCKEHGLP